MTTPPRKKLIEVSIPLYAMLAIVEFLDRALRQVHYVAQPFAREPNFDVARVNYAFVNLLLKGLKSS